MRPLWPPKRLSDHNWFCEVCEHMFMNCSPTKPLFRRLTVRTDLQGCCRLGPSLNYSTPSMGVPA